MSKNPYPSDQQDKFMLRLPDGMRDRIKAEADKNGRSMNAEIVALLDRNYPVLPTAREVLESSGNIAFWLGEAVKRQGGDMDSDTRRAAKSLIDRLQRLQDLLNTKD